MFKWNPFKRVETRASYTDSARQVCSFRQASGSALGQASATAAVEACAVALCRHAFAGARLEPEVPALSPDVLATIARSLLLDGEIPLGDQRRRRRAQVASGW